LIASGKTRSGKAPEFDAPIVLNTIVSDPFEFGKKRDKDQYARIVKLEEG
jgi:hypothetical protein